MENLDSRKSIHSLAESVHSLLGLKTHLTSSWVDSVCNIIKTLPIKGPQRDHNNDDDSYNGVDLESTIMRIKGELAALTAVIRQLNMLRREALNDYIDLKGNARVFCRVKPFTLGENSNQPIPVLPLDSSRVMLNFGANKSKIYKFDKVFHPHSSQDEFFQEVEPVIKSAMDGYNVCIFAYGQTGSGKTFTMEGTADNPGVIPRAIEAIYKQAADDNHTFILEFSMLEIYMGHLKDLLVPQSTKATNFRPPCPSMRSDSGEVEIDNLVTIQVSNFNQTKRLYRLGCRLRSTASTLSNEFSSRSHCMIRLLMTCVDGTERRRVRNKIWMVDLGGSERVLKTKAWGRRFEEGKAINLSLSALGDVINSLQKKNCHIPYRNSKLTQVLKDSLGEDSKTLMLVHVSPKEEDLCETVCSLNFATRVRSLHLGTEEPGEVKAQKEVELTSLQERMKWTEIKRHEVSIQISKLNEKLEHLMESPLSSSEELEVSHLSFQVELSQSQTKPANNLENVTAAPSLESPRFMRPTICSRRKSGINPEASGRKKLVPRGRRSSFHHAESLTSSGSIVSRTNCSVGSELRYSSDVETEVTEHSKDKSECDVKMVVCHLQDKPPRSSNYVKPYASSSVAQRNQKTNELNSSKYLKDNGLHVPKNASGISSTHWNMRVPAIPNPVNSRKGHLKGVRKTMHDKKLRNNKSPKKMIQQERLEKVDYLRADLTPRSGVKGQIIPTMNKDFSTHDSRIICISPTDINDGIMMIPAQDMKDGFSCEDCICNTPPEWHGVFDDNEKDKSGVYKIQLIKYGREIAQSFLLKSSQTSISSLSDASGSITSITEDFDFPYSRSELRSTERIPYIIGNNREAAKGEGLLVDRARLVVLTHELQSQGRTKSIGICSLLKQKIQILCTCVLLGLGFDSFGFEQDFFYALML